MNFFLAAAKDEAKQGDRLPKMHHDMMSPIKQIVTIEKRCQLVNHGRTDP